MQPPLPVSPPTLPLSFAAFSGEFRPIAVVDLPGMIARDDPGATDGSRMTDKRHRAGCQLRDFAITSRDLFWQRQATVAGATVLAAYYANITIALFCYGLYLLTEFLDERLIRQVLAWDGRDDAAMARIMNNMTVTSALSAMAVAQYIVVMALAEGPSLHLGPLFFLFAAALYAAMNNCPVPRLMATRMAVYCAALLFIPLYDLWLVRPPLDSELWKQMGVVMFVLYLLIECARKFLDNHNVRMQQIEDLRVERDRVAAAYDMQSKFVSVVSHELRTPLTTIKASLDLITGGQMAELPQEVGKVAEIGRKSSNRLAILIDDLLDFQKLRSGKLSYRFGLIDLGTLIDDAVAANRALGTAANVTIRSTPAAQPITLRGDTDRLVQVLTNVLSNAIKFSDRDGVVDVWTDTHAARARIFIRDRGIGIPDDARDIVFEPFKQVDSSDRREFGGTGLGMSIAKQIIEDHGGSIDYVSEPGAGTIFVLEIDLLPPVAAADAPASHNHTAEMQGPLVPVS
jgi:signal transduction histidine kinase